MNALQPIVSMAFTMNVGYPLHDRPLSRSLADETLDPSLCLFRQTSIQRQDLENIYRLLQLFTDRSYRG